MRGELTSLGELRQSFRVRFQILNVNKSVWFTLIGRGISRLSSHWSRVMLYQLSYAIKNQLIAVWTLAFLDLAPLLVVAIPVPFEVIFFSHFRP